MEDEKIYISESEAEEFGEFKRQKRLFGARENINRIELDADVMSLTCNFLSAYCMTAYKMKFRSVRVSSQYVKRAKGVLREGGVKVAAVVGRGNVLSKVKLYELKKSFACGADEAELYVSVASVKNSDNAEIKKLLRRARFVSGSRRLYISAQTGYLSDEEIKNFFSYAYKLGVKNFAVEDMSKIDIIKRATGADCNFKCRVENTDGFKAALAMGIRETYSTAAEDIASQLLKDVLEK